MKILIITVAVSILYAAFLVFQVDNNLYLLKLEELKEISKECSAAAAQYYDLESFKEGEKVFNKEEGNKAIRHLMIENLNLDTALYPIDASYWSDQIAYYVFYFDDSKQMYAYYNEELQSVEAFSYGVVFTDPIEGYRKVITEPCVIVTIAAGKPNYRLSFLKHLEIQSARSSAYEYVDRR